MRRRFAVRPSGTTTEFHGIHTVAPQMQALFTLIARVARSDATVLVRGETGTGKELVARALHRLSGRARGPFQAINCATLTPELLASELFGHVRGSFTGAIRDRQGLFRLADRGTVFLDEIAEMPLDLQARLLRVLQERSFTPLGGVDPVQVDIRVVSATHKSLRDEARQHRFREDLMYRIRVVPLFLPPLIERSGDIEALTWHFVDLLARRDGPGDGRRIERIEREVLDALLAYPWPGNVRELSSAVAYAYAVGEGPEWTVAELLPELRGEPAPRALELLPAPELPASPTADPHAAAAAGERARLLAALQASGGRKGEAAERLGIDRSTLWRKLREHRL
jgi:two-component system response regulator AtoC